MIEFSLVLMCGFFALFIALLVFLSATLFQPVLRQIEARKSHLQSEQGGADEDIAETARLQEEAGEIVRAAKREAANIKEEALAQAKIQAEARLGGEREKIAKELGEFEKTLQTDETSLKSALLGEAPLFKERIKAKFIAA
jgi:F-type H+-transporting ATPase subunit b